jgi:hypothetical protein
MDVKEKYRQDVRKGACWITQRFLFVIFMNIEYFSDWNVNLNCGTYRRYATKYAAAHENPFYPNWRRRGE